MSIEEYNYNFDEAPEEEEGKGPDQYFLEVQHEIKSIYEQDKEAVYYIRQLQVKFEEKYFHWITNNALTGLLKMGYLTDYRFDRERGTSTRYFLHKSNRYPKRKIMTIEKLVEEYSQDIITRSCGHRAEDLFCMALALKGFVPKERKVKEWNGIKWEASGHDLDFVFEKNGIAYGCEIKNTLGYIQKEELEIKLEMCKHLKLRPLFIMRYSPKSYNKMIIDTGGFVLLFKSQIYELSQENLVQKLKTELGMPADCPKAIPDGIIQRFINWHERHKV
jgi:hypothetical protein